MEKFVERCRELYPVAIDFKPFSIETPDDSTDITNEEAKTNSN